MFNAERHTHTKGVSSMHTTTALTTLALLSSSALAQTPSLTVFQPDLGATATRVRDMGRASARVLAGNFEQPVGQFTWSASEGRQPFSTLGAFGLSSDGQSFVGRSGGVISVARPSGIAPINTPAGRTFDTDTVNVWVGNDASYVIGNFQSGTDRKPFKWTQATGWQQLPNPGLTATRVFDVTPDGTAMVGQAQSFTDYQGYIYREGQGITLLGSDVFPTAINESGNAYLANRIIPQTVFYTAEMTLDGSTTNLGLLPNYVSSYATDLSASANVVVGLLQPDAVSSTAFIWTPQQGMRTITAIAADFGVAFPAHLQIVEVYVSADGQTIAGTLGDTTGLRGFALTIPAPTTALPLAMTALLATRRRR
jgi:hypothetical protein